MMYSSWAIFVFCMLSFSSILLSMDVESRQNYNSGSNSDRRSRRDVSSSDLEQLQDTVSMLELQVQEEKTLRRAFEMRSNDIIDDVKRGLDSEKQKVLNLEREMAEFKALQTRDNPHFIRYERWFQEAKLKQKECDDLVDRCQTVAERADLILDRNEELNETLYTVNDVLDDLKQSGLVCRDDCSRSTGVELLTTTVTSRTTTEPHVCPDPGYGGPDCDVRMHDCTDIINSFPSSLSNEYQIWFSGALKTVYCDMDTAGGGWLVIQRRADGSETFDRDYADYEAGFGNINADFWLGNNMIHTLTRTENYELRIDMADWTNSMKYSEYSTFSLNSSEHSYQINIDGFSGTAGDSLTGFFSNNGSPFSTRDIDNDKNEYSNCADGSRNGGWWYAAHCGLSSLNGIYHEPGYADDCMGLVWYSFDNSCRSLKYVEMKIRKRITN